MAISKEKFLRLFLDEFRENLLCAENQIILLKNDPENSDALSTLLRMLHTIKGSTRMLQFLKMEKLVHGTESVFKGIREGRYPVDTRLVRFFFIVADHLRLAATLIEKGQAEDLPELERLLQACEKLGANEPFDLRSIASVEPEAINSSAFPYPPEEGIASAEEEPEGQSAQEESSEKVDSPATTDETEETQQAKKAGKHKKSGNSQRKNSQAPEQEDAASPELDAKKPQRRSTEESRPSQLDSTIRVESEDIDHSINLVNTLTLRQLRLRAASEQLDNLEKKLSQAARESQDLRLLRKQLSEISRSVRLYRNLYADQLFEIEHGTQELRERVISMRMLPLSVVLDRFPRMVEETASSIGKEVSLNISGEGVRLDRTVLSKLSDPLIHIVRNAIDHGIEAPEIRLAAGKPARGSLSIVCKTEGSRVSLIVSDDGAGLDYPAIRQRAISLWPEEAEEIAALPESDLIRFLFKSGFTTKNQSSTLSGRGIGLDIVKTNIEAVKGQIQLESLPGQGSSFTLLLPTSASTIDGMFVLSSEKKFFIPASAILRTLLIDSADCFQILQKEMFNLDGNNIPLTDLALGLNGERRERRGKKIPVLLVRGPAETIGLAVDRILGYDSLVYQALPSGLKKNQMVQGIVFDERFNIIPILNMWVVIDRLRSLRLMDTHKRFSNAAQREKPMVLVVDDSISTREIEMSMLELEGYSVVGAIDGLDALEKIRGSHFDIVISDINMPRMDGMKLLENIRRDESLKALPFIFVSTVEEPELRAQAEALGANRYILKSSFEQDNLISAVRDLIAMAGSKA